MPEPRCPSLYQINTRVWLTELSRRLSRPATLDDVPEGELDRLARMGFDWLWLLSVWSTGLASKRVSRAHRAWREQFERTLPDLQEEDIAGSGFAITAYSAHPSLGGDAALKRFRVRLHERGLRLMLDFVPNHTALDHPWVEEHPSYYVAGTEADLAREPHNFTRLEVAHGELILAHGRDPHFPGWTDTLQLDYSNPDVPQAMSRELQKVAALCDGARCDMAMLLLPDVFARTWGRAAQPFWPKAIEQVRGHWPGFRFLAEVYWGLESALQEQGFDYTYDKGLYDRLVEGKARPIRDHFHTPVEYQRKLARFLENHDEPRIAATLPPEIHKAAAVATFLSPCLRFFHQGQFEGRKQHISAHLVRAPQEPTDEALQNFYAGLLAVLRRPQAQEGEWQLLECVPAGEGNWTWNCFLAHLWSDVAADPPLLAVVNYAPHQSQCFVRLPFTELRGRTAKLKDLLGTAEYDRVGDELLSRGLYLDLPPWGYHVFAIAWQVTEQ